MKNIENEIYTEERALYGLRDACLTECMFVPAMGVSYEEQGESALKESHGVRMTRCRFLLRYPLWHAREFVAEHCVFDETSRASVWYAEDGLLSYCRIQSVKALRECRRIRLQGVIAHSEEFGWRCHDVTVEDSFLSSDYLFFQASNLTLDGLQMQGKYSFQYVENARVIGGTFDTKDAFWHSKNVTVEDAELSGAYLGWYSENLTLIRCKIKGTQPFCYCKNLVLRDCTMTDCDLAFEYSSVQAEVNGYIDSVKNPLCGTIVADGIGEVITDHAVKKCNATVRIR
ncbi:MAG: DUF3737 family protein [Clostridia bacterium]|nr:DUF3737 family protein [Clostridia bacterium]